MDRWRSSRQLITSVCSTEHPCDCVHSDAHESKDSLTAPGESWSHRSDTELRAKVLFVSYTADWTGPTNSLLLLLKHLRGRYDVAVLLPGQGLFSDMLEREQIPFFRLPNLTKWYIPSIFRLIRSEGFDLVYGNTTHGSSRNSLVGAKLARVPFICHVREMGWGKSWGRFGFLRMANATIAVSRACSDSIAKYVPRHKLHIVHNGVDRFLPKEERESARANLRAGLGLSGKEIVAISVGHVCPRKGQMYAVKAIALIARSAPDVHLIIVGSLERDNAYANTIRDQIDEMGLNQKISLIGFRNDVLRLLQGADVFVHTAIKDPHPRSVVEAMSVGLPVAAFSTDGVAESVKDGKTGYLHDVGDVASLANSILRLSRNPLLRIQMGQLGRHNADAYYSAHSTANKVARIINDQLHPTMAPPALGTE